MKEKSNFMESNEGFTYIRRNHEERISQKLLTFILSTDISRFGSQVNRIVKKIKQNPDDEFDTEYVDVDHLMSMYVEQFKLHKKQLQKNIQKQFERWTEGERSGQHVECTVEKVTRIM